MDGLIVCLELSMRMVGGFGCCRKDAMRGELGGGLGGFDVFRGISYGLLGY